MTEDVIEQYGNFNTKGCPEDLTFGDFNNKSIPSTYSDIKNYYDYNGTPIDADLADNVGVEEEVMTNDENNNGDSLDSDIDPPPPPK